VLADAPGDGGGAEASSGLPEPSAGSGDTVPDADARRILLAEDNEVNQVVTREILRNAGFGCDVAATGREAIEAALARPYDLILMDCEMPEMDGLTATGRLRQLEADGRLSAGRVRPLPIVALTAHVVQGDRRRCLAAGMNDYITKPVDPAELLSTIRLWLRHGAPRDRAAPATPGRKPADPAGRREPQAPVAVTSTLNAAPDCPAPDETWLPASPSGRAPLDTQSLRDRCMDKTELMQRVLQLFIERARRDVNRIRQAIEANDAGAATQLTHAFKGVVANVSARPAAEMAAELERLSRANRLADARPHAALLEEEVARCIDYVGRVLAGLAEGRPAPS
jgi:Amt family ammonium transporter